MEEETIPELLQWITSVGAKAYPEVRRDLRDRVLSHFFISALTDEKQREYVWRNEPDTVGDAAQAALKYEGIRKVIRQEHGDLEEAAQEEAGTRKGPICFECGRRGHFAKQCRRKDRSLE